MQHGNLMLGYNEKEKKRTFEYVSPLDGKTYSGEIQNGFVVDIPHVGRKSGDTFSSFLNGRHCCGASGFGQPGDECSACVDNNRTFEILRDISFLLGDKE